MIPYIARRLAFGLVLAVMVTAITFSLLSLSFDSISRTLAGLNATPENVAAVKAKLGYDRPLAVQYVDWVVHAAQGDFGKSLFTGEPVTSALGGRLAVTLSVVLIALLISAALSTLLGVLAATRGGATDRVVQVVILFGYIVPGLIVAILLVFIFAVQLKWLPATGFTPITQDFGKWARSVTLPAMVLIIGGNASLTAQIRGAMADELRKDYVRTLRTRGVSQIAVTLKHALRNAAGPALTVLSLEFIGMFGGALIIEKVFALPGFGAYGYNASLAGDIPVILGLSTFGVLVVILVNLAADLMNGWLNPKARIA